ncbi:MAG: acylneuraminate cytidylyltransferase family protein [Alphaproteobacteria bacterium]|nr:acylneuraminate cytidylyltransferase family protein [Alphaproteobacteria bacterium]
MIQGRTVLAVVPARGGSKGIALKNLCVVGGTPLVARVGEIIRQVECIDRAVVSTDHDGIAQVAEAAGIAAPFRRPKSLSGDRIGDVDVLTHALGEAERIDRTCYDIIVMLQPTSPLRTSGDVLMTITKLVEDDFDAAWTVSETDSKAHPFKQLVVENGNAKLYDQRGGAIIARQQLSTLYHRNGAAYALTRSCLLDQKTLMGERTGAVVLKDHHISIDTEMDIELAEFFLSKRPENKKIDCVEGG